MAKAAATAATNVRAKGACTDSNPGTRLGPHSLAPPHGVTLTLSRTQVLDWVLTPLSQAVLETVAWDLDPHNQSYSLKMQESMESSDGSSESGDGGAGFLPDSSGDEAPTSTYITSLYSNHEPRCVTNASCKAALAAFPAAFDAGFSKNHIAQPPRRAGRRGVGAVCAALGCCVS